MVDITALVKELTEASDLYYNGDGSQGANTSPGNYSPMTDVEYDAKEDQLRKLDPTNEFLIRVGSSVRGGKVKLPFIMGSLDQVKEGEALEWVKLEGLEEEDVVVTAKEDGNSISVIYGKDGTLRAAYSRGCGEYGHDVTRHVRRMKKVPQQVSQKMAIRAEVIISNDIFDELNLIASYKNARAFMGQMNSKESTDLFYDNVDIVAYEILKLG